MSKSEKTRQMIIEKSAAIINRKGVAGTSISDLMEATNLAKGGIYGNFESKEEICVEAFNHLISSVRDGLNHAAASKTKAKDKLFALLDYYQNEISNSDEGGCPLLNFGLEADDTNPVLRQRVAKSVKTSLERISKIVQDGKASGEFGKPVDPDVFATKMFAMIEGAIFTARLTNSQEPMKTIVKILKKEIENF